MLDFLLLYRIEDTNRHGGLNLVLAIVVIFLAMSLAPEMPL